LDLLFIFIRNLFAAGNIGFKTSAKKVSLFEFHSYLLLFIVATVRLPSQLYFL